MRGDEIITGRLTFLPDSPTLWKLLPVSFITTPLLPTGPLFLGAVTIQLKPTLPRSRISPLSAPRAITTSRLETTVPSPRGDGRIQSTPGTTSPRAAPIL